MPDPYILIIALCVLIGLSYLFNIISRRFNIPSVLLLIAVGIIINYSLASYDIYLSEKIFPVLQILGIVGLIMIVLEAAVDLKLSAEKSGMILKSFGLAFIVLFISSISIALVVQNLLNEPFINSLAYAIPLSVVSSAVLIPSVHNLAKDKKEFMIYESTFSDILGIMLFNFLILRPSSEILSFSGFGNILLTIVLSFVLSYLMVFLFQKLRCEVKLFLMIAILALLFAIGKKLHMSSLLIILIFGLVMNNSKIFFKGAFGYLIDFNAMEKIADDFRMITAETAFVIRTFFFIAFGMSINLSVFQDSKVIGIGLLILLIIYLVRYINFKLFLKTKTFPEVFLAPRGLITILLFYSIPAAYLIGSFSVGILSFVILGTSLIMMLALVITPEGKRKDIKIYDLGVDSAFSLARFEGDKENAENNSLD